ncbi:MAG TPA: ATP-binding cassette domain-containing protein [Syntrophomonadaceae bacterium]|nr:ATP-binding cassette domain-containing protein [Syntrophomonadaceae bacterium]
MSQLLTFDLYRHFENEGFLHVSGGVEIGELLMVRGPSGVGKSTLLKMLARLIEPEKGKVNFHGCDWKSFAPMEWRQRVQYVSQQPVMFDGSVRDNLIMPFKLNQIKRSLRFDSERVLKLLKALGCAENILDQEANTLSGGEAARIALIRAILVSPELLLLDEPTAYLDEDSKQKVKFLLTEWIGDGEHAIIEVSHQDRDLDELPGTKVLNIVPGKERDTNGL